MLRTAPPVVNDKVNRPDKAVRELLLLPQENLLLDRKPVAQAQRKHAKKRPRGLHRDNGQVKLWVDKQGRVWIPEPARQLQQQMYALAHQGMSGHRGKDATVEILSQNVFWENMERDVATWRAQCLQCLKLAQGGWIPRPLGLQLIAEFPGEVLNE